MANNFDSNFTRKLARVFLEEFESQRIVSKNVNTQLLTSKFKPDTGDTIHFKRPTDYKSKRTPGGDITGMGRSNILTGKASGTVQEYFTVDVEYEEADEALKMDQLDELLAPMATRIVTDVELDFAEFMLRNAGLRVGTVGTPASTWEDVALAAAMLKASGVPADAPWCYALNSFAQVALAKEQRSLGAGDHLVKSANAKATVMENFAGMTVKAADTLASYTTHSGADRVGALSATPTATYAAAKDTMTQSLAVTGFQANLQVRAGETVTVTGRNRLNLATRKPIIDATGANVLFSGVVTQAVALDGAGAGTLVISGPGIFEAAGAYNTVDSALANGDVVTLGGAASTLIQPNMFWHKNAFSIGAVPIKKLHSTDTLATTEDGLQFRISRYSDGDANKQIVRIDFRPAFAALNPFFAGQGFGKP